MKFMLGFKFAGEVCDVLGLDKNTVTKIELTLLPAEVVAVKVSMLVEDKKGAAIVERLRHYRLITEDEFEAVADQRKTDHV